MFLLSRFRSISQVILWAHDGSESVGDWSERYFGIETSGPSVKIINSWRQVPTDDPWLLCNHPVTGSVADKALQCLGYTITSASEMTDGGPPTTCTSGYLTSRILSGTKEVDIIQSRLRTKSIGLCTNSATVPTQQFGLHVTSNKKDYHRRCVY